MTVDVPDRLAAICEDVRSFIDSEVIPTESELHAG